MWDLSGNLLTGGLGVVWGKLLLFWFDGPCFTSLNVIWWLVLPRGNDQEDCRVVGLYIIKPRAANTYLKMCVRKLNTCLHKPLQWFCLLLAVKYLPTDRGIIHSQKFQLFPVLFCFVFLANSFWSIKSYWTFFVIYFYP